MHIGLELGEPFECCMLSLSFFFFFRRYILSLGVKISMILCAAAAAIDDTITAVHTTSTLRFCLHA